MAQKYLGIDLGSHQVNVVVATAGLRNVNVLNSYDEPVVPTDGEDSLAASVRVAIQLVRDRGLAHLPAGIALPGSAGSYRVLKFPFSDQKRIVQAISFEIDGQFPVPLTELEYDHVSGSAGPSGGGRALVVAVKRSILDPTVEAFRQAGVDVRMVTAAPIAVGQVLSGSVTALGPDATEGSQPAALVLDIGDKSTELIAVNDKLPIAVRTLRRGGQHLRRALQRAYGFDEAGAEVAKERDAFLPHKALGELSAEQAASAKHTADALEAVVREVEHTRLWLRSELDCELTELRLTGGTAELRGMQPFLQEQLGLPTRFAEPNDGIGIRGTADLKWTRSAAAVGAAYGAAKRPLIQLYDVTAVGGDGDWLQEKFTTLATLGIAIVAFAAVDTIVKVKAMEAERNAHAAELASASYGVFGEELSALEDVEARLESVERADLTAQLPDRGAFEVLEMISRAAAATDVGAGAVGLDGIDPAAGISPGMIDSTAGGVTTATAPDGSPSMFDPSGNPVTVPGGPPPAEGEAQDVATGPVDPEAGILLSDQLLIKRVDIRQLKIELRVEATRATAQDRLALKLEQLGCITKISKGKVRDSGEKKLFEMEMDHGCFGGTGGGN